jgi:serine protein kinase
MDLERTLDRISRKSMETFAAKAAMLSFPEYLAALAARPYTLTRNAAQILRDAFEHEGSYEVPGLTGPVRRFRIFDGQDAADDRQVFGHEEVQNRLFEILCGFVERGRADRFILLHGPSGSAKSSIVEAMRQALERYSRSDACPVYRFSWIFCESSDKGGLGFTAAGGTEALPSLAAVDDRLITSRLPCEMKDPPFFLLPKRRRLEILNDALRTAPEEERRRFLWTDFIVKGELSPKNKAVYESLIRSYRGDWRKVMRHVRIERYYISHRYRTGAVTIEPQGTIDAGVRLLATGASGGLPAVLQHEELLCGQGDLVDANGGLVEYSDFLKRSLEANKYLLTTAERGAVNLPGITIALNLVLVGTTEEKFLTAFKRDHGFPSFRGRFELVRVPYLRQATAEAAIYERHLARVARHRHVAPHFASLAGLFAVMTRMRRPDSGRLETALSRAARKLSPLEKALFYDTGEAPLHLGEEEQTLLREHRADLVRERDADEEEVDGFVDAAYEGRRGVSPREILALATELAVRPDPGCLTPLELLDGFRELVADPSLYDWLRVDKEGEYRDPASLIGMIRQEHLQRLWDEIRRASGLVVETEAGRLFGEYLRHVKAYGTGERVAGGPLGAARDPDRRLMAEVETHLGVTGNADEWRRNLMTRVAAYRLSHPDRPLDLARVFPDLFLRLDRSFYRERRAQIDTMIQDALLLRSGAGRELPRERVEAAEGLFARFVEEARYCEHCAPRMLAHFQRHGASIGE